MFNKEKPDHHEVAKEARRDLATEKRNLDKELRNLERQETKAVQEAKMFAKRGDNANARLMAKQVVQIRSAKDRMLRSKAHLSSISLQTSAMEAQTTQMKSMKTASDAMVKANSQIDAKEMSNILRQFEKQSDMSDMKTEMMDDLFDDPEMDQEADAAVMQIFDELGADTANRMQSAPRHQHAETTANSSSEKSREDDILRQLEAL
jgi:hypothetical protein